jgi:DNA polymerase-3 subunit gamma/tau
VTTALYRRYRPESFGEMIGQSQVTEPLMTALRADRVGHAYLFSGPRGCGKTTSARILARCLNCAQGPTDTPCGECDSCIELGRGGGGSLDVVEIDAASHNGVDDARDLRERAVFAPARDRFKIFILDEAHMVTPQGFNALLKLVEEPPDHVKFIFATTEPEKVIGTIRSRTHHYPFRLVPPAAMLAYVEELCESEGVTVEPGVLPLVVRAGGGSPRDTLSLLDQLIAGSDDAVTYPRAVALLGYTHAELLDEVVDAFARTDAAEAFAAVDRVVQTGQDPRRFVDDLLERLRDLIVIAATGQGASAVLRGISSEDLARMATQAEAFGTARLSRTADIVIAALDEMTGATSPRLQLELMVARVLAQSVAHGVSVAGAAPAVAAPAVPAPAPAAAPSPEPSAAVGASAQTPTAPAPPEPAAKPAGPLTLAAVDAAWPRVLGRLEDLSRGSWLVAQSAQPLAVDGDVLTLGFSNGADETKFKPKALGGRDAHVDVKRAILEVLGAEVKFRTRIEQRANSAGSGSGAGSSDVPPADPAEPEPPHEDEPEPLRAAEPEQPQRTGAASPPRSSAKAPARPSAPVRGSAPAAAPVTGAAPVTEWAVAAIPGAASPVALAVDDEPEDAATEISRVRSARDAPAAEGSVLPPTEVEPSIEPTEDERSAEELDAAAPRAARPVIAHRSDGVQRYGEAVVRQILGATFIGEEPHETSTRFG